MKLIITYDSERTPNSYCEKIADWAEELGFELIGFVNLSDEETFSEIYSYPVYPLHYAFKLNFDMAFMTTTSGTDRFISVGFPKEKLAGFNWLLQQKMIRKYEDCQDPVIQETLRYWERNPLSVFNQHFENVPDTFDEVFTDENSGLPYIWFETVEGYKLKMYYPRSGCGSMVKDSDGKMYVKNILQEQVPSSPHLYVKDNHRINFGDILIDCGVCEGNFALKYVDVCSKIYLFEPDPLWLEPLWHTFENYLDKVVLIPKYVSNFSERNFVSIDDKVKLSKQNVFLKMDVEGAEISALHGAKNLLRSNSVKASICSYHNSDDLWKIKSIFKSHNYTTWTSDGYMVFIWDENIFDTADFRKGIVYAENY